MTTETTYQLFANFPSFLRLMIILISLLSSVVICLVVYLQVLRTQLRNNEIALSGFKASFEEMIIHYLLNSDLYTSANQVNPIFDKLSSETRIKFNREVLVSALVELHRNVTGDLSAKVRELYVQLDLPKYAIKKLKSWHWSTVIKGLHELSEMEIKEADVAISPLLGHKRTEIRSAAQLYKASVFEFRGLEFLNNLQSNMSEWQQIQLLEGIRHSESENAPNISRWLRSRNNSVVSFALKLAEVYNLVDVGDSLIPLLIHADMNIRIKAISVLAHLGIYSCKDLIMIHFEQKKIPERIAIAKAMIQLIEPEDLPTISKLAKAPEFEIRRMAILTLRQFNPEMDFELQEVTPKKKSDSNLVAI